MSVLNLKKRAVSFAIVATLTLLYAAGLAAQGVQGGAEFVAGRVTDKMTGEPLPGVFVLFQGYTYGAMTDDNGYYRSSVRKKAELSSSLVSDMRPSV